MNNLSPVFYNAESVRRVLNWPMVNEAVEAALKAVVDHTSEPNANAGVEHMEQDQGNEPQSNNSIKSYVSQPARSVTIAGNDPSKLMLTMPAFVGNYRLTAGGAGGDATNVGRSTLACKVVTSFRANRQLQPPLPSICANIMLFNVKTGELEAIMAGTDITTWRTVSASLVATKYLYFRRFGPRAEHQLEINVAIVGCGAQGQLHAAAMCANFKVKQLNLYNRTESQAVQLASQLRQRLSSDSSNSYATDMPDIKVCSSAREAVAQADVICMATYAREALIHANDLREKRSVHINAVGAGEVHFGEVSADIYAESLVYVDCMSNAEHELVGLPAPIAGELGGVIIHGNYPDEQAVTIFQSMGMASEDACVAEAVQSALLSCAK
ncbi:ketimine reductase mu-crystallin isoform X1 [Drosophila novamexicana]|uniref:ketimine reductase mu-crystallin isoform X1 n=1 Tax=Drosophila novamexicana TaxID=47314 RepID=UPI0011E5DDBF|nr:ketimine reductase mu-crystallin isoform X1 [Drosophila novamexicana]